MASANSNTDFNLATADDRNHSVVTWVYAKGSTMFRGRNFQYSTVRLQTNASLKTPEQGPLLLRSKQQRLFAATYPSLVLAIGVAAAAIAVMILGMLG